MHGESLAGYQHSFVLLCNLDLLSVYYTSSPVLAEDTEVGTENPVLWELTSLRGMQMTDTSLNM